MATQACPPYAPFFPPKLGDAPSAPQDPARGRAADADEARRRRNEVETSFLDTGKPALSHLRYIAAEEIAGHREKFAGSGTLLSNSVSLLELSVSRNVATASRFERAQSFAWSHLAWGSGALQLVEDELVKINRDRLSPCASDRMAEFADLEARDARGGRNLSGRYLRRKRSASRSRQDSSNRAPKRGRRDRGRTPNDSEESKDAEYKGSPKKDEKAKGEPPKTKWDTIFFELEQLFFLFSS